MANEKRARVPLPFLSSSKTRSGRVELESYQVALISVVTGLIGWQIFSDVVIANSLFLASPTQVLDALVSLSLSGELWAHVRTSAAEFLLGYGIAAVIGIATGMLIATSPFWKSWLQPWISGLYATPTVALGPLFILWLGIGIWSKVLVVVLLVVANVQRLTEINQYQLRLVFKVFVYVVAVLQIAVHDIVLVAIVQRLQHLFGNVRGVTCNAIMLRR